MQHQSILAYAGSPAAILGRQQKLVLNAQRYLLSSQQASLASLHQASSSHATGLSHNQRPHDPDSLSVKEYRSWQQSDDTMSQDLELLPSEKAVSAHSLATEGSDGQQPGAAAASEGQNCETFPAGPEQPNSHEGLDNHDTSSAVKDADSSGTAVQLACGDADALSDLEQQQAELPSISDLVHTAAEDAAATATADAAAAVAAHDRGDGHPAEPISSHLSHGNLQDTPADAAAGQQQPTLSQQHPVPANSSAMAHTAAQYPWMHHSISEDAEGWQSRQQPHVTFSNNALASMSKLQCGKVPFSYVAAAAGDKADRASTALHQKAVFASPLVTHSDDDIVSNQPVLLAQTDELQAGAQLGLGSAYSAHKPSAWPEQATTAIAELQNTHDIEGVTVAPELGYGVAVEPGVSKHDGASSHSHDVPQLSDADASTRRKSAAGSATSYAGSAASGLSHLMRAQQPWSTTSSSSSSHEEPVQDISQLQGHLLTASDVQHALLQQQQLEQHSVVTQQQSSPDAAAAVFGVPEVANEQSASTSAHAATTQMLPERLSAAVASSGQVGPESLWHITSAAASAPWQASVAQPADVVSNAGDVTEAELTTDAATWQVQSYASNELAQTAAGMLLQARKVHLQQGHCL